MFSNHDSWFNMLLLVKQHCTRNHIVLRFVCYALEKLKQFKKNVKQYLISFPSTQKRLCYDYFSWIGYMVRYY